MRRLLCLTLLFPFSILIFLSLFSMPSGRSAANLRRITNTSGETLNLNPTLSGDGRVIAFESSADLLRIGGEPGFHAIRASVGIDSLSFAEIGRSRMVTPGVSQDGSMIVFSSTEDLVGRNSDRNSEIYLQMSSSLRQITETVAGSAASRLSDGSFQPSISDNGQFVVFASNRDLVGMNADLNAEVFEFDLTTGTFAQLTNTRGGSGAIVSQVSGDGSRVVFLSDGPDVGRRLSLLQISTRSMQTIDSGETISLSSSRAISDDGSRVVYSLEAVEHQSQVWLYDATSNRSRQITNLGSRVSDVPLNPAISGDGKRIAFATRRRVLNASDGGVELYLYDTPTAQFTQVTQAPQRATAEVVASLNDEGSLVAFSFARALSDETATDEVANNSEVYLAGLSPRAAFGDLTLMNAAARGNEPVRPAPLARGSIVVARGAVLAFEEAHGRRLSNGFFPMVLAGTTVTVNGLAAQLIYVSPGEVHFVVPDQIQIGPAEIVVTNADGFPSRATASVESCAPGIFSFDGDGGGEGVLLNAESLVTGPFDPSSGQLRLSVFATGVRNAANVSAKIDGVSAVVESVHRSAELPGLDEIHVLVPLSLRGAGSVDLQLVADDRTSNTVTVVLSGSALRDVTINEFLADPPDGIEGDANHDGTRSAANDEFVEVVNSTPSDLDLGGYQLKTRSSQAGATDVVRHRFPAGSILRAGAALVVFGGGTLNAGDPIFGGATVVKASTGGLSLANGGGTITIVDGADSLVSFVSYGGVALPGDANQSLTRSPDVTGSFVLHKVAEGSDQRVFSPGTRVNGTPFATAPPPPTPSPTPTPTPTPEPSPSPTTPTPTPTPTPEPSPSPTPVPSPSPSPTPSPTPTPTPEPSPSPSPVPSPSPSPTPSPTPSPSPAPQGSIAISQIYGGGGNAGAPFRNDFIELFNRGNSPVDLTGWSIQYASATSSSWSVTPLGSITLAPGKYLLIQEASGGSAGAALPAPDVTGTINLASSSGKVALVSSTIALTGPCPSSTVDLVGYGTNANCFEGSGPAPAPSNTIALQRSANGCGDSQNNSADFATGSPQPRNTTAPASQCQSASVAVASSKPDFGWWFAWTFLRTLALRI